MEASQLFVLVLYAEALRIAIEKLSQWAGAASACIFDGDLRNSSNQKILRNPRLDLKLAAAYL